MQDLLKKMIKLDGPISMSRYMQLCLTHPEHGYYNRERVFGIKGDFVTAPHISQLFGEMCAIWCLTKYKQKPYSLVELGPGNGQLMSDMLNVFKQFPDLQPKEIHFVEKSLTLKKQLKEKFPAAKFHSTVFELNIDNPIIIANEFFDALPVMQFKRVDKEWKEIRINFNNDFELCHTDVKASKILEYLSSRFKSIAHDIVEVSPETWDTSKKIGELLKSGGSALIMDYGYTRPRGSTFRAIKDHKFVDFLSKPGERDLTYDVDFEAIRKWSQCKSVILKTQKDFLLSHGIEARLDQMCLKNPEHAQSLRKDVEKLLTMENYHAMELEA